jgi:hypothetical protein
VTAAVKLAGFAALLVLVFGAAAVAGDAVGPEPADPEPRMAHGHAQDDDAVHPVRGLAVSAGGLRLVLDDAELRRGETERVRFRIVGDGGETVRDFDVEHERRMHLIIARRDLTGFQHLHPRQAADGSWSSRVRVDDGGSYRVFADFSREDEPMTLGADLRVDGAADLRELPAPAPAAVSDGGYDVRLRRDDDEMRFTVTRGGRPVDVEPYLGARGHLVALREGDLAFLHVHPDADRLSFEAEFPSAGRYRLFLQFKDAGRVQTVAFTQEVA